MARPRKWTLPDSIDQPVMEADPSKLRLEHYLTYRISRISRLLDTQTTRFLNAAFGISISERRTLARLSNGGQSTVRDIADYLSIDKAAISRALTNLVDKGFVTRADNPEDARSAIFTATKAGEKLERAIVEEGLARQLELLNRLTPTERKYLYTAFAKIDDYLAQKQDKPPDEDVEASPFSPDARRQTVLTGT